MIFRVLSNFDNSNAVVKHLTELQNINYDINL